MIYKINRLERDAQWGVLVAGTGKYLAKYDECHDKWVPGLSKETGLLRTGLEEEASDAEIKKHSLPKDATKQDYFEKVLSLEKGTLAPSSEYWLSYMIIIPQAGLKLNSNNIADLLKITLLSADPMIAEGFDQAKRSTRFEYVMTTEGAEAKVKNTKRDITVNAFVAFSKLSATEVVEALYMFGKTPDDMGPEVCRNELGLICESNPSKFLAVVGDKHFKEKIKLIKMIKEGIIRKGKAGVGYDVPLLFGDISLGTGLDEVIVFILDPENSGVYSGMAAAYKKVLNQK